MPDEPRRAAKPEHPNVPSSHSFESIRRQLTALNAAADSYAADFVDAVLGAGHQLGASDIHLRPTGEGLDVAVRIDGVLQDWGVFPTGKVSDVVTRLKVLAELLTYRTDVPQEGRVRNPPFAAEVRVSSFPTLHGEKVVVRLFAAGAQYPFVESLGLPDVIQNRLLRLLDETAGAILITGPAGSGKTTTAYACVRDIVRRSSGGRSVATLEDPVEVAIAGAAQSQVNARAGFDLAAGLRSMLRQDPEVILVGEMRDPATAGVALQASLTGQLVLTTFHASSAASAISRLLDMGLEPYMVRSGILAVISQRLVRKLCQLRRTLGLGRCQTWFAGRAGKIGTWLRRVPWHRLPRSHSAGGNVDDRLADSGCRNSRPPRRRPPGASRRRQRPAHALELRVRRRFRRAHQRRRSPPCAGFDGRFFRWCRVKSAAVFVPVVSSWSCSSDILN